MNATEQRIAIAGWCGWNKFGDPYPSQDDGSEVQWWRFGEYGPERTTENLPDYLNDLNASTRPNCTWRD